jgi:NAD(P)-dependent dehydrogenase (short-subunit alcohol dehydrogenase family)
MIDANVSFILNTLHYLLNNNKINNSAKMVIISSIWEESTRPNKLSYTISKSALSGLVKNISYDLSSRNILINNVLPGVIDNEMSRKALSEEKFNYVKNYMNFNRLITLNDVYKTIKFLVIDNTGITGQSIKVDLGFTDFTNL